MPSSEGGYDVAPRVIETDFVAAWEGRPEQAKREAERLRAEILGSVQQGRPHELTPFTGQRAGLVHDLPPTAEVVRRMVAEAEDALERAAALRTG
jgi:enoyl-[acyl-carrier protein] reductase II